MINRTPRTANRTLRFSTSTFAMLAALFGAQAHANPPLPTGGTVTSGSAALDTSLAGSLTVNQTSNRAVLNWQSFDVGLGNAVVFNQPNASAATLNRVTGTTSSEIAGQISANGTVFLINPNGIQITKSGTITAGRGFVASTLDIANQDFMNGTGAFTGSGGSISNAGTITTLSGGYVGLLGGAVANSGTIIAPAGRVVVAGGTSATLDLNGGNFLSVALPASTTLSTDGSLAALTPAQARAAVRAVVNLPPEINAQSMAVSNGTVTLGGTISVDSNSGNAGSILALGQSLTATGSLSARATGGANGLGGGNGGQIETSGAVVNFNGLRVDTSAAHGTTGTWLVDPTDLTVDATAAATISTNLATTNVVLQTNADGSTTGPGVTAPGAGDININSAIGWAGTNSLTLSALHNININAALSAPTGALLVSAGGTISASAAVNVGLFNLAGGNWVQNNATLPAFSASDFRISGGTFLRAVGGDGSLATPYLLTDVYGLQRIDTYLTSNFALANDVGASSTANWNGGAGFVPIGNGSSQFSGSLDGRDHVITNLFINRPNSIYQGLFGWVGGAGRISNLGLVGGSVTGFFYTGALVGYNSGGIISRAFASAAVSAPISQVKYVGGLVGFNDNGGLITTSYATGAVSGPTGVDVTGDFIGGLVGYNVGSITSSYASGAVSVNAGLSIGGLVGKNTGSISQAYASGAVTTLAGNTYAQGQGGLVGVNDSLGVITNAYATGVVIGQGSLTANGVGGLTGTNLGAVNASFFNADTGNFDSIADPLTTAQLRTLGTFTAAGWSIDAQGGTSSVWRIYEGQTAPLLRGLLTPLNLVAFDGSAKPLANIGAVGIPAGADASKIFGSLSVSGGTALTLSSSGVAGSYIATANATISSSLYSNQQGYDIIASTSRTIATPGSAAGTIRLDNALNWTNGTLRINTSGSIYAAGAINGGAGSVFDLAGGTWVQFGASLPSFAVNDFRISGGSFLRATSGDGSVAAPYTLTDVYGLQGMASSSLLGQSFSLGTSIDATGTANWNSGAGFAPIGTDGAGNFLNGNLGFTGSFTGNSNTISNLTINRPTVSSVGLFGAIGANGVVSGVGLLGGSVSGANNVGGLGGNNGGTISNAYATGTVSGRNLVGGLVGYNSGTISDAHATGAVSGTAFNVQFVGGLVGLNSGGTISNAYATGAVSSTAIHVQFVGGLVGANNNSGTLSNTYATGAVNGGYYSKYVGGLIGYNDSGTISNAYATGAVSGVGFVGGLGGYNRGTISNAHATGAVSGTNTVGGLVAYTFGGTISNAYATGAVSGNNNVGGLVGFNNGTISNAYATGAVSGTGGYANSVGGLVGFNNDTISNAYATGAVTTGGYANNVGGLVGFNNGTISNAYATGAVTTGGYANYVGGLGGYNRAIISNAYATGAVSGNNYVGGLIGTNVGDISNTYATGAVSGTGGYVGGLGGYNRGPIRNSFWNATSSGTAIGIAGGYASGATGNTTAQMQTLSTFTAAGWSIDAQGGTGSVWRIYDGQTAPLLRSFLTPLTLTANSNTLTYNGAAQTVTGYTLSNNSATLLGTAIDIGGTGTNAGSYAHSISGLYSNQQGYDLTSVAGALTINQALLNLSISADSLSRLYGNTNPTLTYKITAGSLQGNDTLSGALATTATQLSPVGTYAITQGTLGNPNYAIAFTNGVLSVTPRPLSVTADAFSRVYGGSNPTLTYVVGATDANSGLVNGDGLTGALATVATSGSNVGTYGINQGTLSASNNYTLSYTGANLSVTPAALTVTYSADPLTRAYGDSNPVFTGGVSASGLVNGDTLAGVTSGSAGFTTSATTASNVGSYAITGAGLSANSANYNMSFAQAAGNATALTITTRGLTLTPLSASRIYGNANPTSGGFSIVGGLVNGDTLASTLTLSSPALATSGVGSYALNGSGARFTTGLASNYAISYAPNVMGLTITPRALSVTADAFSRVYGGSNPTLTYVVGATDANSGLVNGDGLTGALATVATSGSNVGTYAINQGTLSASNNYTLSYTGANLSVTPAALTVTYSADPLTRAYGDSNPVFTGGVSASGLVNGDTLAGVTSGSAGFTTSATTASNVGSYAITGAGLSANSANYNMSFAQAAGNATALTINPARFSMGSTSFRSIANISNGTTYVSDINTLSNTSDVTQTNLVVNPQNPLTSGTGSPILNLYNLCVSKGTGKPFVCTMH